MAPPCLYGHRNSFEITFCNGKAKFVYKTYMVRKFWKCWILLGYACCCDLFLICFGTAGGRLLRASTLMWWECGLWKQCRFYHAILKQHHSQLGARLEGLCVWVGWSLLIIFFNSHWIQTTQFDICSWDRNLIPMNDSTLPSCSRKNGLIFRSARPRSGLWRTNCTSRKFWKCKILFCSLRRLFSFAFGPPERRSLRACALLW